MSNNLTPLQVAERLIAPLEELGPLCGLGLKAAYMWRNASKQRAAGDIAPVYARRLLAHSASHKRGLTADHLIWGAPEAEIAAILAARDAAPLQRPAA